MALSDADAAYLVALKAARLQLATGKAIAEVTYNGETRKFAAASNIDRAWLDSEIATLEAGVSSSRPRYGTVRVRL